MRSLSLIGLLALTSGLAAQPFTFLQAGFTQELYATSQGFMGGVAFAPDGDPWVNSCSFNNGTLRRFDSQTTVVVQGTSVHPEIASFGSNVGCGMTNHPDGFLYNNTSAGVTRTDADTGLPVGGAFGPAGNALGITPHPVTLELVYVGSTGDILAVDNGFTTSRTVSTAVTGDFLDGIYFDPTGEFLFCANRTGASLGGFGISIIRFSDGTLVQHANVTSEPDGIAFHTSAPQFVVSINLDGTMTRFDFPGNDFTQAPTISLFASGGFRGDLSQVEPDGCLYLTQDGTRFDNGTTSGQNSLVRICGGFAPPVSAISLDPLTATCNIGENHTVTATVTDNGSPLAGALVTFDVVAGPNLGLTGQDTTDAAGQATFTYTSAVAGTDTLQASFDNGSMTIMSNPSQKTWEEVAECWLIAGMAPLNAPLNQYLPFATASDVLRVDPILVIPMSLTELPELAVPSTPLMTGTTIYTQGFLLNPGVFPNDPIKLSQSVAFHIGTGTSVVGAPSGLLMWSTSPAVVNPGDVATLSFTIL